jgi:hypothetical protein
MHVCSGQVWSPIDACATLKQHGEEYAEVAGMALELDYVEVILRWVEA